MRSAQTATRVPIKVLAEEDQVFPVGIGSVTCFPAVARPVSILVRKEEIHQPTCNVLRNFDKCVLLAAAGGLGLALGALVGQVRDLQDRWRLGFLAQAMSTEFRSPEFRPREFAPKEFGSTDFDEEKHRA